ILLFFGAELSADAEAVIAADQPRASGPAVCAVVRDQRELLAALEIGDGIAQRSADALAAPALQLEADPAILRVEAAEIIACGDRAVGGQFIAGAAQHGEVERIAAAAFGIALFLEAVIVDPPRRTQRQA